jgi:hypothetical protein
VRDRVQLHRGRGDLHRARAGEPHLDRLGGYPRGDGEERVGDRPDRPLEQAVEEATTARQSVMDAEAVEGVHHHRRVRQARRQPAEEAALG